MRPLPAGTASRLRTIRSASLWISSKSSKLEAISVANAQSASV
jgi:hypothetical protein